MTNYLSAANSKLAATAKLHGLRILTWGIPAFQARDGFRTCPMAGTCKVGCYATQGAYTWSNVAQAYERRLELSRGGLFVETVVAELKRRQPDVVRVHDSGDFYNLEYTRHWFTIMTSCPDVRFYAYTKMVPLFKRLQLRGAVPPNLTIIFSYGGLADAQIDPAVDRHSVVFSSHEEMVAAGYADTTEDDLNALGDNHRIGLVYHGAKGKTWSTKPKQLNVVASL